MDSEQSPNSQQAPLDPEMERLKLEKLKAEARQAIAEAREKELDAITPDLKFEVPQGSVKPPDKASPVATLIGYRVLGDAADAVSNHLRKRLPSGNDVSILVVEDLNLASGDAVFRQIKSQLSVLRRSVDKAIEQMSPALHKQQDLAAPIFLGAMSALPGILSLFKRDLTVVANEYKITFAAVAASLANSISRFDSWRCYVHHFRPTPRSGVFEDSESLQLARGTLEELRLQHQIEKVDSLEVDLAPKRDRLKVRQSDRDAIAKEKGDTTGIDSEITGLREEIAGLQTQIDTAKSIIAKAASLLQAVDTFLTSLYVTPSGSKYSPIIGAALYEGLHDGASSPAQYDYVLFAEAAYAGGESVYEEKAARPDRVDYIAGCAITYLLTDREGVLIASGTQTKFGLGSHKIGSSDFGIVAY